MVPVKFYNRVNELATLERAWGAGPPGGRLMLLSGRRRLGKTFLLQRFFSQTDGQPPRPHVYYLAEQTTAAAQRLALAELLLQELPNPGTAPHEIAVSWNALLRYVTANLRDGARFGLILDEFPYLLDQSPELASTIQAWWDREAAHTNVFVVLCGSHLSTMSSLGSESAPLFGRFNAGVLKLAPMRYYQTAEFYKDKYEKKDALVLFGALGGSPRYHAMVDTSIPMSEALIDLIFRPHAPLENEVRFLLSSEQIREPAPYNAVLGAIAMGETQFARIQQQTGIERGALSYSLRVLQDLEWIYRELPFGETSERRGLYRIVDPFLEFWYRFPARLQSHLQFSDPRQVFASHVEPFLPDYMGWRVFELIAQQWLALHAESKLGLRLTEMGRYWSRDGQTEIDVVAAKSGGGFVFGECKWSGNRPVGLNVLADLKSSVARLPETRYRQNPTYILFSTGGFTRDLLALAADRSASVLLVGLDELLNAAGTS